MPVVATLSTHTEDLRPLTQVGPSGYTAGRVYLITGAESEDEALTATGLPVYAEAYSVGLPALKVVRRAASFYGGVYYKVEIVYETPGASGAAPAPEAGQQWTEAQFGVTTVTVHNEVNPPLGPTAPIDNGRGAPKRVGVLELLVHKMYAASSVPWAAIRTLNDGQLINNADVTLPPVLGGATGFTVPAGQLQFLGIERVESRAGVAEVVFRLGYAADFKYRWQPEDLNGDLVGAVIATDLYATGNFATVFA